MVRITGLTIERFESLYWADRADYDSGALTGKTFFEKIAREAGLKLSGSAIDELIHWDARMWMNVNAAMLAWQLKLKQRGLLTAIVSNMGDAVLHAMEREFDWLSQFDVLVWSYQLRIAKPNPAIYRYVLDKLRTRPEETLFIDDRKPNVDAALDIGMKGIVFTNVGALRADLISSHLDQELSLP